MSDRNTSLLDSVLDDPKGDLQYVLLRLQYVIMEMCETLVEAFKPVVDCVCNAANSLYALGYSTEDILAAVDIMSPPHRPKSSTRAPQHITKTTYTSTDINRSRDEIRTFRRKRH